SDWAASIVSTSSTTNACTSWVGRNFTHGKAVGSTSVARLRALSLSRIKVMNSVVVADALSVTSAAWLAVVSTRSSSPPRRCTRSDLLAERCSLPTVSTGLFERSEKFTSGSVILLKYLKTTEGATLAVDAASTASLPARSWEQWPSVFGEGTHCFSCAGNRR